MLAANIQLQNTSHSYYVAHNHFQFLFVYDAQARPHNTLYFD